MFQSAIAYLWNKTPDIIKWPVVFLVVLIWTPLKLREELVTFIRIEVHAIVDPMKANRDTEITGMKSDLADTKSYVRAIGIHLMGERRFEEKVQTPTVASDGKQ